MKKRQSSAPYNPRKVVLTSSFPFVKQSSRNGWQAILRCQRESFISTPGCQLTAAAIKGTSLFWCICCRLGQVGRSIETIWDGENTDLFWWEIIDLLWSKRDPKRAGHEQRMEYRGRKPFVNHVKNGRVVWACLQRVCSTEEGFGASIEPSSVTSKSL